MSKTITRHIPNTITCCNLFSGCVATCMAFSGEPGKALLFIILGAVFDFFDGMTARLLHVSSPIGKELDSLADDVTFGVAPATMVYSLLYTLNYPAWLEGLRGVLPYVAFVMAAFAALRLAKFNLDERQTMGFIGLPTPANALFWGSLVLGQRAFLVSLKFNAVFLFLFMLLFCMLLVSEVPMLALKFKDFSWEKNKEKFIFLLGCLPCFLLGTSCFAAIIVWYVVLSIIVDVAGRRKSLPEA